MMVIRVDTLHLIKSTVKSYSLNTLPLSFPGEQVPVSLKSTTYTYSKHKDERSQLEAINFMAVAIRM
jgi:hypothetical protein